MEESQQVAATQAARPPAPATAVSPPAVLLTLRSAVGGALMGLANLVPGISGGTMLLAAGIYPRFIQAIADLTRLRLRWPSLLVLGTVVLAAVLAIGLLAGPIRDLVVHHRWMMYSLFIGLTLGGVPVIWKLIGRHDARVWVGMAAGFAAMAALAWVQQAGMRAAEPAAATAAEAASAGGTGDFGMMLAAGIAGASAMILPGLSGGYLLLVMGQYVPILTGIDQFKDALQARDLAAAMAPATQVLLPVGLGVVLGVVVVSNLIRWLLGRFEKATLGVLLGLLLGAVVGLWPFQHGVEPPVGSVIKGRVMTPEAIEALKPWDYPVVFFTPTAGQVAGALVLIVVGAILTGLVARLGRE